METKANYLLIGIFSLAGFLGILGFVLWFAKLELNRQFAYYDVYFDDVAGIGLSSDVRFAGLSVGRVADMQLSDRDDGTVRVRLELQENTPVRTDSTAGRVPQGVTGTFAVSITAGSPEAPLLRQNGNSGVLEIPASRSVLQTLADRGPEIIDRLGDAAEELAKLLGPENQARVSNILENVERSSSNLDKTLADVSAATGAISGAAAGIAAFGSRLEDLGTSAQTTLAGADTALAKFTESAGNADRLMASGGALLDDLGRYVDDDLRGLTGPVRDRAVQLEATLDNLDATMEAGRGALGAAESAFTNADRLIATDLGPVATDLRTTLATLNTSITQVAADLPEITGDLRNAAGAAQTTFTTLNTMVSGLRSPLQAFSGQGLPQFTRLASEMRGLVSNIDSLVTALRRNPPRILSGDRPPEFRR